MKKFLIFLSLSIIVIPTLAYSVATYTTPSGTQFGPTTVSVSTYLQQQAGNYYGPKSAVDGSTSTAWVEGVKGNGVGQWIKLQFDSPTKFATIVLRNGYAKNNSVYFKNSRIKGVRVSIASGQVWDFTLKDTPSEQTIKLPGPAVSPWVKLTILSVYPGTKYTDTALTEISVDREEFNYR